MRDLIDREALYEKTAEWEATALHMVEKTMNDEDKTEWRKWTAILGERTAFKHDVADAPSAQPEPRWTPCSERLPEALEEVLVTSKHGYVYTSRIVHGEFEYGGEVIAWMPLPEPYKEDSDG